MIINERNVRIRYLHNKELAKRVNFFPKDKSNTFVAEHVLTLATYLEQDKLYLGYSLNRINTNGVPTSKEFQVYDKHNKEYAKNRAIGRLKGNGRICLSVDPSKKMIHNIIEGVLSQNLTEEHLALRKFLKKNLKQFQTKDK